MDSHQVEGQQGCASAATTHLPRVSRPEPPPKVSFLAWTPTHAVGQQLPLTVRSYLTFKNRMSALRSLAGKIGKQNIVARENADRHRRAALRQATSPKASELDADKLAAVLDPFTALSLRLQEAFGLRREESIKLRPTRADRGDVLHLKASWTKGEGQLEQGRQGARHCDRH